MDLLRAAFININLPKILWPYAMDNTIYINNRLLTAANCDIISPIEKLYSALQITYPQSLNHLRAFGYRAYMHMKEVYYSRAQKILPRVIKGYLIDYQDQSGKVYRVYIPEIKRVLKVQDVRFQEGALEPNIDRTVEIPEEIWNIPYKLYIKVDTRDEATRHQNDKENTQINLPNNLKD